MGRYTRLGFFASASASLIIVVWMLVARPDSQAGEAMAYIWLLAAMIIGAPLNFVFVAVVEWAKPAIDSIPGVNEIHVLLLGAIVNWTVIGWWVDDVARHRGRPKPDA